MRLKHVTVIRRNHLYYIKNKTKHEAILLWWKYQCFKLSLKCHKLTRSWQLHEWHFFLNVNIVGFLVMVLSKNLNLRIDSQFMSNRTFNSVWIGQKVEFTEFIYIVTQWRNFIIFATKQKWLISLIIFWTNYACFPSRILKYIFLY